MTSLAEERDAQAAWSARSRGSDLSIFDRYIENEFSSLEEQRARISGAVAKILKFAAEHVPFYANAFRNIGVDARNPDGLENLARIGVLSKHDVQKNAKALCADALPPGHRLAAPASSSGTTGRRTVVQRCTATTAGLVFQKQREYRWFRFDPAGSLAYIQFAYHFPPKADGSFPKEGETLAFESWPHIGKYFVTGPHHTFNVTNAADRQLEFLRLVKVNYLMTYAETLEHLAFAAGETRPCESLKGLVSISEQLTPGMRRRIQGSFATSIRQNYGLNEIGLVATECESGRFHVHTEHCWVEIVDDAGHAVSPGETGRVLVTSLNNTAMPLLRYDTGDLAAALGGPCPCGRTLPSFGPIMGRYSRIAFLPEGTLAIAGGLREAVESLSSAAVPGIALFQIHQSRDGNFELRVVSSMPLADTAGQALAQVWNAMPGTKGLSLRVVRVENLSRAQGGKFQVFTSDFMPVPDQP